MPEKAFNLTREMLDHSFAETVAPIGKNCSPASNAAPVQPSCPTAYAMDYTPASMAPGAGGLRDEALHAALLALHHCYSVRTLSRGSPTETMAPQTPGYRENVGGEERSTSPLLPCFMETVRRHGAQLRPTAAPLLFQHHPELGRSGATGSDHVAHAASR